MKTARYIILFALFAVLTVGCAAGPQSTEETQEQIEGRKENFERMRLVVEDQMRPLEDLFEVRWSLPVHDTDYTRVIENVQVIDRMICLYGSDANLLFVDGEQGSAKSFFNVGYDKIIFPLDHGFSKVQQGDTQVERLFVYFSNGKDIFCLSDPLARSGALYPQWTAKSACAILTPIGNSDYSLYFGCADGKIYSLSKLSAGTLAAMRPIIRVKSDVNIGIPVAMLKASNYPFCIDDKGNLYLYDGIVGKEQKPVRSDLPRPTAPMLVDDETRTLLIPTVDFRLYALDAVTGTEKKWVAYSKGAYITGEMKLHQGSVYVHTDKNELLAFAMRGGNPLWDGQSVPHVAKVIGPARDDNLYLLMDYGALAKLDIRTGKILFERPLPDVQFIVSNQKDGAIFLVNDLGRIWAISER